MAHKRTPRALGLLRLLIRERTGLELRDYVFQRHAADPNLTIDELGLELGVKRDTWRRYLRRLDIGTADGPRLVDLRECQAPDQPN